MKVSNNQNSNFPPQPISIGSLLKAQYQLPKKPQEKVLRMTFPKVTKQDFKTTIDRYIQHIAAYNEKVTNRNQEIKAYNIVVNKFNLKNATSEKKVALIVKFTKQFNYSSNQDYNQAAISFNKLHGTHLKLRLTATVKPTTRLYFEAFLHSYSVQLHSRNDLNRKASVFYKLPIPKIEINPHYIINQQRNGVLNLPATTKTVRSHRDRLEEAGVLLNKQFNGSERPVSYELQPSILALSEGFIQKSQLSKNQFFKSQKRKELPHNKVSTRTYKKISEKKEIVNSNNENAPHLPSILFYKNTKPQDVGKNLPPPENLNQLSQFLFNSLEEKLTLAKNCEKNHYYNYQPIKLAVFQEEIKQNNLTNTLFREVLLQEFIRISADINKHNQATFKSWLLAFSHINKEFRCINFKNKAFSKQEIYDKFIELTWRINWAKKWFDNRDWQNVRFANNYFNSTFNNSGYVGFGFTLHYWQKSQAEKQKLINKKTSEKAKATRLVSIQKNDKAADRRLTTATLKFLNKHYTFEQLNRYVVNELPKKQQDKLPARLETLLIRKNKKK